MKRKTIIIGAISIVAIAALAVGVYTIAAPSWSVPATLHYQGRLTDSAGSPVTGITDLTFRIWDSETGGTALWEEPQTINIPPSGYFSVVLAKTAGYEIGAGVLEGGPRWLGIEVGSAGELTPRQEIHSVPYALKAGESAHVAVGADLDDGLIGGRRAADLISELQAQVAALGGDGSCPAGYTHDSRTDITLCKKGLDEMVKVGDFWIDRYEGIVVDETYWHGGACDGSGTAYGGESDNWSSITGTFPFTGNWSGKLYTCSKSGATPSRWMTWFQAQQALAASGKHLCTNEEWQAAVAGTNDPGVNNGISGGACHTDGSGPRVTGSAGSTPGAGTSCISRWGAEDMIGNLSEWAAMWGQAGPDSGVAAGAYAGNVTTGNGWAGFSPETSADGDGTWNLAGTAYGFNRDGVGCGWKTGLPFAALRGGNWDGGALAGAFALDLGNAPSYRLLGIGFRGCRR